jgi:hypothetical protein
VVAEKAPKAEAKAVEVVEEVVETPVEEETKDNEAETK